MSLSGINGYSVIEEKKLPEVNGVGYVLSHNKTKARVMIIENDDTNKVFTIGFRTPPKDDTGVPHIMEHSVLCGSKKFPVKDPFVELCKGSLNTFLNAMTYSDKTVYPVASLNKKDFHNLMHVYLDAVFYPNIYEREEIMMQEGWHYEYDEETDELKYNGVVFNEMKGVYSSAEQQLYREIEASLLPDTIYGFESGGDPVKIPDLTREKFIEFHQTYYHPSNSYIYLYGDMDVKEELEFIDKEYLSAYEYKEIDSAIEQQKFFDKPVYKNAFYSLADADEEKENTYLTYNVLVGKSTDKKLCTAMAVLERAIITAPGAPIKKALIDAKIGKDVFSSYDDGINQPTFSIIAKNANDEDEENFIKTINDVLRNLVENGIDKKSLKAAINMFEFKHKEGDYSRYPKGLMLGLNAFGTWLYDDAAALDLFSLNEVFEELKTEIETGYFENLIKEYLLDNNHKTYVKISPKRGLNELKEAEEKKKLADFKATLSENEIKEIIAKAKHLEEYQEAEDGEEELKTIPMLEISDIEKNARKLNNQFCDIEMVKVVSHDIFTNGISYLNLDFDVTDISYKKYPVIALLTEIFKNIDTANYSYNDLSSEINIYTGGIGFVTSIINKKECDDYALHFVVSAKMLHENVDKAMEIIDEILFTTKLDDKKRLKEIISETRTYLKNGLVSSGHLTAAERAVSYISPIGVVKELTEGIEYYKYLSMLDDDFDNQYDNLVSELKTVLGEILRRDALIVNYTSDRKPEEILTKSLTAFSKKLSTRLEFDKEKIEINKLNEGFKTASQVQYVATAGNFIKEGLKYTGALSVLQVIFSYDYLWINVRVKGGAYGSMCSFNRSGNVYFTSYRDPNLMETYNIYKEAASYVEQFNANERDMTKYIIGAIAKLDTPLTPSSEGSFYFLSYLMGITDEELQQTRDEVLNTTVSTIRSLAPYVKAATKGDVICAVGGETKIEAAKDNFKEVLSVF